MKWTVRHSVTSTLTLYSVPTRDKRASRFKKSLLRFNVLHVFKDSKRYSNKGPKPLQKKVHYKELIRLITTVLLTPRNRLPLGSGCRTDLSRTFTDSVSTECLPAIITVSLRLGRYVSVVNLLKQKNGLFRERGENDTRITGTLILQFCNDKPDFQGGLYLFPSDSPSTPVQKSLGGVSDMEGLLTVYSIE